MSDILKQANDFVCELDKLDRKEYAEVNFEMVFAFVGLSLVTSPDIHGTQAAKDLIGKFSEQLHQKGYKIDPDKLYKHIIHLHTESAKDLTLTDSKFCKSVEKYFNDCIWNNCISWEGSECRRG